MITRGVPRKRRPVLIVFGAKSSRIYVFRDGVEISRAVVRGGENMNLGIHAYTALDQFDSEGHRLWSAIETVRDHHAPDVRDLAKNLSIPPALIAKRVFLATSLGSYLTPQLLG